MYFNVVPAADSGGYPVTSNAVVSPHICSLYVKEFQTLPSVAVDYCNNMKEKRLSIVEYSKET